MTTFPLIHLLVSAILMALFAMLTHYCYQTRRMVNASRQAQGDLASRLHGVATRAATRGPHQDRLL